jgi:hypothetical protein
MVNPPQPATVCAPSAEVVARLIEGDVLIVPIVSGIGDADEEIFTLNETGRALWLLLDGRRTLRDAAELLSTAYAAPAAEIEADVIGLAAALLERRILVECPPR